MPEGPEIRRIADQLSAALLNKPLHEVWFAFPKLQSYSPQLHRSQITGIETRGKALLTHFSIGLSLYSHNQLYGRWIISTPDDPITSTRSPRVRIAANNVTATLYSASNIELWPTNEVQSHPFLQRIGPDVLDKEFTSDQVAHRLLQPHFARRNLGALLLDQSFFAGLGNYLRAEILWRAELSPSSRPQDLTPEKISSLAHAILNIPRLSYATRGLVADSARIAPDPYQDGNFHFEVFKREGMLCSRCGSVIQKATHNARPLFFCAHCQSDS
ncbi:Formamidopyrimidine-DNA glycosylase [gamma proteobacterium HdN1]|nr:Formamidopyrimidine-DNA glycosylase [gamma proteobacterium HdN1]